MCIKIDETTTRHDGMIVRWRIGSSTWLRYLESRKRWGVNGFMAQKSTYGSFDEVMFR
jgi:hypothetical protein